jgi:hypothetical protein
MLVRCEKCGYENFPQHRFCGMCAAELRLPGPGGSPPVPSPARVSPPPVISRPAPPPKEKREEVVTQKVSGPSFLGLGNEPADSNASLSYLLEEDEPPDHRARNLILIVLIVAASAGAWNWRQDLRVLAGRLLSSPPPANSAGSSSAQDANSAAASTSAPPANSVSPDNQVQQPPQAPVTPAPVATTTAASGAPESTQSPGATPPQSSPPSADQSQLDQSQTDQPPSSNPSQPSNSASSTEAANSDDSQAAAPTQAPPEHKAARLRTQPTADDLAAEGEKYLYGNGVPENCTRARTSLLAAAQRSSAQAQSVLGTMYATGHCATRDLPTAYRWFSRSLRKDPSNTRIEQDLKVLWNQMTPQEKQLALRDER